MPIAFLNVVKCIVCVFPSLNMVDELKKLLQNANKKY